MNTNKGYLIILLNILIFNYLKISNKYFSVFIYGPLSFFFVTGPLSL